MSKAKPIDAMMQMSQRVEPMFRMEDEFVFNRAHFSKVMRASNEKFYLIPVQEGTIVD
jgi:hypothetical protein